MGTIVFAALLPVQSATRLADELVKGGVRRHLVARLEQKQLGVLTPDAPIAWRTEDLPEIAVTLATRYIVGVGVLALEEANVTPVGAPGAVLLHRATVRASVWDGAQRRFLVESVEASAEGTAGMPGPNPSFRTNGFIQVVTNACVSALAPLL